MRLFCLCFAFCALNLSVVAQDTLQTNRGLIEGEQIDIDQAPRKFYDPKVATKRSAIIPGWGQIYNDSWWKVPIIYAGLGACVYYIDFNQQQFKTFENLAQEELAKPPAEQDPNALRFYQRSADAWRKNRDLVFLTTIGVYALQVLEANIDAHLKGFNVDEELALNVKPKVGVINNGATYVGFGFTLPIGK